VLSPVLFAMIAIGLEFIYETKIKVLG